LTEVLDAMDLSAEEVAGHLRRPGGFLSEGVRDIARAIVAHPQVLFADEPTGNLDTTTSNEIMKVLAGLNEQRGITIVMVTHEPDIAAWTRRIVRFRDGAIESDEANTPVRGA